MMSEMPDPHPPTPAPPTEQGEFALPKARAVWPTVIGIISIVLGSLGALGYAWSCIAPYVMESSFLANDPNVQASIQAQKDMRGWMVSSGVVNLIASLLLLIAGTGLSSRRSWGVSAARLWAVFKMLTAIFTAIATYIVQEAALANQSGGMAAAGSMFGMVAIVFVLAWAWAFPIFMLVWLSRPRVKAEYSRW